MPAESKWSHKLSQNRLRLVISEPEIRQKTGRKWFCGKIKFLPVFCRFWSVHWSFFGRPGVFKKTRQLQ
jgi:hypothetical protein